eukprot:m.16024 g.16024  ORF g.16024 m.16024 type:complete len:253 (+) comp10834_c1_seq2:248-1006(+)
MGDKDKGASDVTFLDLHKRVLREFKFPPQLLQGLDPLSLRHLNFNGNKVTALPSEDLEVVKNLEKLHIGCNKIIELPDDFGAVMICLTELKIHDNKLHTLPHSIGLLKQLRVLDVHNNFLESLPDELCDVVSLTWLMAGGNKLTHLPSNIGKLQNVQMISLRGNNLTTLPPSFGDLTNLTKVYLTNNPDLHQFDDELIRMGGYSAASTQTIVTLCRAHEDQDNTTTHIIANPTQGEGVPCIPEMDDLSLRST